MYRNLSVKAFVELWQAEKLVSISTDKMRSLIAQATQLDVQNLYHLTRTDSKLRNALLKALIDLPLETWTQNSLEAEHIWSLLPDYERKWLATQTAANHNPLTAYTFHSQRKVI